MYRVGEKIGDGAFGVVYLCQHKITKNIVPSLNYFDWQENKAIDYHTLKYVIFQNSFRESKSSLIINSCMFCH